MEILQRFTNAGIVPVVVLENAEDAVPTAKALLDGGIDVMEITFRTAAAPDAIRAVAQECPDMVVGAGTVITLEQCQQAVSLGAKFIVSPGFDAEVVRWCVENKVAVTPGCVTPTEIMAAMKLGLKVLKFFPANVYGGLNAMKALSGPFGSIRFIPTGGVNAQNIAEYSVAPFIHAIGGSWVCAKGDIAAHKLDRITALCREARQAMLGYAVDHVGVNNPDQETATNLCDALHAAFNFEIKPGNSSNFVSSGIEVMKLPFLGAHGHISVATNRIEMAVADMEKRGYELDMSTAKYKGERLKAVYFKKEFGGFAVHLRQR